MKYSIDKLSALQRELTQITKDVQAGTLPQAEAADRIIRVKEEIDEIIKRLQGLEKSPTGKK